MRLDEKDLEELVKLYRTAQTTPVMALSSKDMIEGRDWASIAWNEVRHKMDEFGKKYGFNPETIKGIDFKTGEVKCL